VIDGYPIGNRPYLEDTEVTHTYCIPCIMIHYSVEEAKEMVAAQMERNAAKKEG